MKFDLRDLRLILIDVFTHSLIPENISNLKINDFEEWDSLGNFSLLLAIEEKYNIKFGLNEISELNSINTIADALGKKID